MCTVVGSYLLLRKIMSCTHTVGLYVHIKQFRSIELIYILCCPLSPFSTLFLLPALLRLSRTPGQCNSCGADVKTVACENRFGIYSPHQNHSTVLHQPRNLQFPQSCWFSFYLRTILGLKEADSSPCVVLAWPGRSATCMFINGAFWRVGFP